MRIGPEPAHGVRRPRFALAPPCCDGNARRLHPGARPTSALAAPRSRWPGPKAIAAARRAGAVITALGRRGAQRDLGPVDLVVAVTSPARKSWPPTSAARSWPGRICSPPRSSARTFPAPTSAAPGLPARGTRLARRYLDLRRPQRRGDLTGADRASATAHPRGQPTCALAASRWASPGGGTGRAGSGQLIVAGHRRGPGSGTPSLTAERAPKGPDISSWHRRPAGCTATC